MKSYIIRAEVLLLVMLLCLTASVDVQASESVQLAGDVLEVVLAATAGGLTLSFKDCEGALQFVESASVALGTTLVLKYAIDERRPNGGKYSFPSLHSSISFSSAEFIRKRYGWEYGIPAYAVASFVAYSRLEARQHFAHDVIAGAAIGIGSSYFFTQPFKGWHIQAKAAPPYYGINLSRTW